MILNLIPQTKAQAKLFDALGVTVKGSSNAFFDSHGNMKSMADIAQVLQDKLKGLTNEQRIATLQQMFGTDALRAANILYEQGAKGIDDMWAAMSKVTAADVAATKMQTLKGAFDNFTSSLETAGIKIGNTMLGPLTQLVRKATDVVGSFDDLTLVNTESALAFVGVASAVALVGTKLATLARTASTLFTTMGPTGWLILGVSALAGVIAQAVVQHNLLDDAMLKTLKTRYNEAQAVDAQIKQYDDLRNKTSLTNDEFHRYVDLQAKIKQSTDPKVIADLTAETDKLREKSGLSNKELDDMVQLNGDLVKKVPEATKAITDQGNAIIDNTSALKNYSAAKLDSLYKDLDLQRISTETKYRDLLKEEQNTIKKMKDDNEHLEQLKKDRADAQKTANEEAAKLKDMMDGTTKASALELQTQIEKNAAAQTALDLLQKHVEKQSDLVQQDQKDLSNTQEKLAKLKSVRDEMSQIVLQQVGLNSKVGEEVPTIDAAINKLKAQKKTLEDTTPAAKRNTVEYQDAVSAIDQQIGRLQTAKNKVQSITSDADAMNSALGKPINKTVTVKTLGMGDLKANYDRYHTGGIVGKGQMPKLHVGGLASQFLDMPNHNEVDVRLLRGEAVLTEAQQANLMRMIDAGQTGRAANTITFTDPALVQAIKELASRPVSVQIDGEKIASATYPHMEDRRMTELRTKMWANGFKY